MPGVGLLHTAGAFGVLTDLKDGRQKFLYTDYATAIPPERLEPGREVALAMSGGNPHIHAVEASGASGLVALQLTSAMVQLWRAPRPTGSATVTGATAAAPWQRLAMLLPPDILAPKESAFLREPGAKAPAAKAPAA